MTSMAQSPGRDTTARAACLERLAAELRAYPALVVTAGAAGQVPCLAVTNTAAPHMTETIAVTDPGGGPVFTWSWGAQIGDTASPGAAAQAIAYVLAVPGARLGQ